MMEITSSGVSVYEVILDLNHWEGQLSNQVPGFVANLIQFMPTTAAHKCMSGEPGGFHVELTKGTNFGHVVEHVLLELIRLGDPEHTEYTGWTKTLGEGRYVIHYGAPDFLTGRLAAILAVEIVGKLQRGEQPDLPIYLDQMSRPMDYFAHERARHLGLSEDVDPEVLATAHDPVPTLSDRQVSALGQVMDTAEDSFPTVSARWRKAFLAFGGDFAHGIVDKVELVNPDHSLSCLIAGEFDHYFQGIANLCQIMRSLRIPLNFVTHAAWLYKNFLQVLVLETADKDSAVQVETLAAFDDFYQNIFHSILDGFARPDEPAPADSDVTMCGFRARQVRQATVLVIDDDILARKAARSILEYNNIPTRGACDGLEGLSILADFGSEICAVVLDLVMPGIDGQVVCRRIRESYPKTKILLCSGFPLTGENRQCLDEHAVSFLQKPYAAVELVVIVADFMDLWLGGGQASALS